MRKFPHISDLVMGEYTRDKKLFLNNATKKLTAQDGI